MDEPLLSKTPGAQQEHYNTTPPPPPPPALRLPTSSPKRFPATSEIIPEQEDSNAPPTSSSSPSLANLIVNLKKKKKRTLNRRHHSAPSLYPNGTQPPVLDPPVRRPTRNSSGFMLQQASILMTLYGTAGIILFLAKSNCFRAHKTYKVLDALYFSVVTLCTIGYGDIVPDSTFTKLCTSVFILVGFWIIDVLLGGLVTSVLDTQEAVLLSTVDKNQFNAMVRTYIIDSEKGRMRIRMKVTLALAVVITCIAIGTIGVHYLEKLRWVDSFYLSITSVTTVGYGDYAFKTAKGRCFAIVWLLVSTLAVAKAFLYLTELRIAKRNNRFANVVLQEKMTLRDLVAADLDNDGSISKSEYIIYKLKEMGRIAEKDIHQICDQFDTLDHSNCGKITVADLMGKD